MTAIAVRPFPVGQCQVFGCWRSLEAHGTLLAGFEDHWFVPLAAVERAHRRAIVEHVIRRDGRCLWPGCNRVDDLTFDHVLPQSLGGEDTVENGQALCRRHNQQKSDRHGPEWDFRHADLSLNGVSS